MTRKILFMRFIIIVEMVIYCHKGVIYMDQLKVGELLKALRKSKGKTQEEVASDLFVSQKTISRWENGESLPDIAIITDVASYYGITVDELLNGAVNNREDRNINNNKKEKERTNLVKQHLFKNLNIYLIISLSSFAVFLLASFIVLFTVNNFVIPIVLALFGLVASLVLFIIGYNDTNSKVDDYLESINLKSLKESLKSKLILFLDIFIPLSALALFVTHYAIFYKNIIYEYNLMLDSSIIVLIVFLVLTYFIIRPSIKKLEFDKKLFVSRLPFIFLLFMIIPIIFLFQAQLVEVTSNGHMIITGYSTLLSSLLIFHDQNYLVIISFLFLLVSLGLSILFLFLKKNILCYIFGYTTLISPFLNAFYIANAYGHGTTIYVDYILSLLCIILSIGIIITYGILKKQLKKSNVESD